MADYALDSTFAALADPTRRSILARLAQGEATVNELAAPLPITKQAVSKHLKVLERAGLIVRGRTAQLRPSRLQGAALKEAADWLFEYREFWDESFDKLGDFLGDGDIDITRVYDVPRERLWRAWTRPDEIAVWWGRRGWSTPADSVTLDPRPGGAFRLNSINDDDGREMPLDAVYVELVEPERIVFARDEDELHAVVTFTDLGGGRTEMRFVTTMRAAPEFRDGAVVGLNSAFDRLDEHLHEPRST